MKKSNLYKYGLAVLNGAFSAYIYFLLTNFFYVGVKLFKGMASWSFLVSIVLLGIGELAFIIFISAYFTSLKDKRKVLKRFFGVSAAEFYLFASVYAARFLTFQAVIGRTTVVKSDLWNIIDTIMLFGGYILGICCTVFAFGFGRPLNKNAETPAP